MEAAVNNFKFIRCSNEDAGYFSKVTRDRAFKSLSAVKADPLKIQNELLQKQKRVDEFQNKLGQKLK